MYRKNHNGQLTIEEFHLTFGGTLDSDNRWVIFSSLMPWEELEETYAHQFSPTTGAPAKPVQLVFGALFIRQRLGLTDGETVEQIRDNAYISFDGLAVATHCSAPSSPLVEKVVEMERRQLSWQRGSQTTTTLMIQIRVHANRSHLTTS